MTIIETINQMQVLSKECKRSGKMIALVPTMGYLHQGHISLIETARKKADVTVVSVFVNPAQFGPTEDLAVYPCDFSRDKQICDRLGVDALFAPSVDEMYPGRFSTWVIEDRLSKPLCGHSRPGHFKGVTTVVCKLFNSVVPDFAVFGQKDAQQAVVIRKMTRDLNFPIEILVSPTVRENDGLAMSSRNKYLSSEERFNARAIYRGLSLCKEAYKNGERNTLKIKDIVSKEILRSEGVIDYVDCVDCDTLEIVEVIANSLLVAVAAFYGKTRLIDNCILGGETFVNAN